MAGRHYWFVGAWFCIIGADRSAPQYLSRARFDTRSLL